MVTVIFKYGFIKKSNRLIFYFSVFYSSFSDRILKNITILKQYRDIKVAR